jgi:YVTN family beta-propeller protein
MKLITVDQGPTVLAVNSSGSRVYVGNSGSNTVSVIDTASNREVATVPVGVEPIGVAVAPNGRRVYVANSASSSVSVIDT